MGCEWVKAICLWWNLSLFGQLQLRSPHYDEKKLALLANYKKRQKKKKKKTFGTDTKQIQNISQITNLVPKSYTLKNENFVSSI